MSKKFKSRKFLLCLAQILTGIGTAIAGMYFEDETIILIGAVCTSVGAGIYTFCEAWVDKEAVGTQTPDVGLSDEYIQNSIL